MNQPIAVERVDHIGIRVRNLDRALKFYRVLGFELLHKRRATRSRSFAMQTASN